MKRRSIKDVRKNESKISKRYTERRHAEGSKRLLVWMTPEVILKIDDIREEFGLTSSSATIRKLIMDY